MLVTYADMPLLRSETLRRRLGWPHHDSGTGRYHHADGDAPRSAWLWAGGARCRGAVRAIVEEADCTPEQLRDPELNAGVYCFDAAWLWENLPHSRRAPKGEYYLTDLVGLAVRQGGR